MSESAARPADPNDPARAPREGGPVAAVAQRRPPWLRVAAALAFAAVSVVGTVARP